MFDSQATASWTAWEVLAAGVRGARSLDNERVCNYLRANGVDTTFVGKLRFNPAMNNFSVARNLVKQIQNGRWVVVWPPALRVAKLQGPQGRATTAGAGAAAAAASPLRGLTVDSVAQR